MFSDITNLKSYQQKEGVGKTMKNSKIKYTWQFELNEKNYIINLFFSKISKKIKILLNNKTCIDKRGIIGFDYKFMIDDFRIKILKKSVLSNTFVLKINDMLFKKFIDFQENKKQKDLFKKKNTVNVCEENEGSFVIEYSDLNNSNCFFSHEINFLKTNDDGEDFELAKMINQK